jgi:hypothetical protein
MTNSTFSQIGAVMLAGLFACSPIAVAQTSVSTSTTAGGATTTSTTTSVGTISEFSPTSNMLVIRSESSPEPVSYSYSKSTTYVDETGAPVSMDVVKSGLPVTVHYVKEGGKMMANRVVVRRSTTSTSPASVEKSTTTTTAPAPVIEEKKTTTTTTESK